MPSKHRPEGYYLSDHRNSPGLTAELANKNGIPVGSNLFEAAFFTCIHCNAGFLHSPMKPTRGYCAKCDNWTCNRQGCQECNGSIHKVLDELEKQIRGMAGDPSQKLILPPTFKENSNG